jgi:hypothetical protein
MGIFIPTVDKEAIDDGGGDGGGGDDDDDDEGRRRRWRWKVMSI